MRIVAPLSSSKQREYQRRHRALGLCQICSAPRVNATYCETHRLQRYYRRLAHRRYTCSICQATGHNRRSCSR